MTLRYRLRGATVKIETTYGTDAAPVATTDAVLCRRIDVQPLDQALVDREVIRSFYGNFTSLTGAQFGSVTLEVELAGFGTAGPATPTPGLDALLRVCGHGRTVSAGTSVVYAPASTAISSATVYVYQAGTLHKFTGCFGNLFIEMAEDQVPFYRFELTGLFQPVTDIGLPTFTTSAYVQPLLCNAQNTSAVSIRGFAAEVRSFSFQSSNQLEKNALLGSARRIDFTDRKAQGSIELRLTTVAVKDWWTDITAASVGPMSILHGTAAGNRVTFASTGGLQLVNPRFSEDRGLINLSMDCRFVPTSAGNDEYSITVT